MPEGVNIIEQGGYVSESLKDYLGRHEEMDNRLTKGGNIRFLTTERAEQFREKAAIFMGEEIAAERVQL
jgi:glutamate racemase